MQRFLGGTRGRPARLVHVLLTSCAAAVSLLAIPAVASAGYSGAVLQDNPLVFYQLNDSSGPTAVDSSLNAVNGRYSSGGVTFGVAGSSAAGPLGVLLSTSGQVTSSVGPAASSAELWVKPSAHGIPTPLITYGDPANSGWAIGGERDSNGNTKVYFESNGVMLDSKMPLPAGAWTMLDVTWSSAGAIFYENGGATLTVVAAPLNWTAPSATDQTLTIGPGAGSGGTSFEDVSLFSGVLSASQIFAHYTGSTSPGSAGGTGGSGSAGGTGGSGSTAGSGTSSGNGTSGATGTQAVTTTTSGATVSRCAQTVSELTPLPFRIARRLVTVRLNLTSNTVTVQSARRLLRSVSYTLAGKRLGVVSKAPFAMRLSPAVLRSASIRLVLTIRPAHGKARMVTLVRRATGCPAKTAKAGHLTVRSVKWRRGILTVVVSGLSKGTRLQTELRYAHHTPRHIVVATATSRVRTSRPSSVVLRELVGNQPQGKSLTAYVR